MPKFACTLYLSLEGASEELDAADEDAARDIFRKHNAVLLNDLFEDEYEIRIEEVTE